MNETRNILVESTNTESKFKVFTKKFFATIRAENFYGFYFY